MISFTFDDFPRSAFIAGGDVLRTYGVWGTYYAALGLMGKQTAVGEIFDRQDLSSLIEAGHELACHTFEHSLCCNLTDSELVKSCGTNRLLMSELLSGYSPRNFSYPEGVVTLSAKKMASSLYDTCRTIESGINRDPVDLGFLRANRIYSHDNFDSVKTLIDRNARENGWLILYTHDVGRNHSPYGCTREHFEAVVDHAVKSGAEILTIAQAGERFAAVS